MYTGKRVFAQGMDPLPMPTLRRGIERDHGHRRVRRFRGQDPFRRMAFAQLTSRESRRDLETGRRAQAGKSHPMGFRGPVSRHPLAKANERRDGRLHADFAQSLIRTAHGRDADDGFGVDLDNTVYALDSPTIDRCLSVFPWAPFRRAQAAGKRHPRLDLRGHLPTFSDGSPGHRHDVNGLDDRVPEAGAFDVMDRADLDVKRLHPRPLRGRFCVLRAQSNPKLRRLSSWPVDRSTGLVCDQVVRTNGVHSATDYPDRRRRIRSRDPERDRTLVFRTHNFALPTMTVADLYRSRWPLERFFQWRKPPLRIKSFRGTSANAVKTRIWIAVSVSVLVAIIRKRLHSELSVHTIRQILDVTGFEKIPLHQLLTDSETTSHQTDPPKQLTLFDF